MPAVGITPAMVTTFKNLVQVLEGEEGSSSSSSSNSNNNNNLLTQDS
jgi:hypothetical protein